MRICQYSRQIVKHVKVCKFDVCDPINEDPSSVGVIRPGRVRLWWSIGNYIRA